MALDQKNALYPRDLRLHDGPLVIKNNTNTLMSFDDFKGNKMTLQQNGKEGDLDLLPREVAENTNFQKMWRQGYFSVFPEEYADEELTNQEQRIRESLEQETSSTTVALEEPSSNKTLSEFTCVEPGCNQRSYLSAKDIKEKNKPPLCENHKHMSNMYNYTEYYENDSKVEKWIPIGVQSVAKDIEINL